VERGEIILRRLGERVATLESVFVVSFVKKITQQPIGLDTNRLNQMMNMRQFFEFLFFFFFKNVQAPKKYSPILKSQVLYRAGSFDCSL